MDKKLQKIQGQMKQREKNEPNLQDDEFVDESRNKRLTSSYSKNLY